MIPGLGRSPGEGKDYPLQYCGLENSMGCIVHGVAKSWTRLGDFHFQVAKGWGETCESKISEMNSSTHCATCPKTTAGTHHHSALSPLTTPFTLRASGDSPGWVTQSPIPEESRTLVSTPFPPRACFTCHLQAKSGKGTLRRQVDHVGDKHVLSNVHSSELITSPRIINSFLGCWPLGRMNH